MDLEALSRGELETLVRFLMTRVSQGHRHDLMAQHPVTYVKVFPHTVDAVRTEVNNALTAAASGN